MSVPIDKQLKKGVDFVRSVAKRLGIPNHPLIAAEIIKSVFSGLRDGIYIHESCDIVSKLPAFVKDAYLEEWDVMKEVKKKSLPNYLKEIEQTDYRAFRNLEAVLHAIEGNKDKNQMQDGSLLGGELLGSERNN